MKIAFRQFLLKSVFLVAAFFSAIIPGFSGISGKDSGLSFSSEESAVVEFQDESCQFAAASVVSPLKLSASASKRPVSRFFYYFSAVTACVSVISSFAWIFFQTKKSSLSDNKFIHTIIFLQTLK